MINAMIANMIYTNRILRMWPSKDENTIAIYCQGDFEWRMGRASTEE